MNWNSNILWGVLGIIFGGLTSYFFYKISKKKKSILCNFDTFCIISEQTNQISNLDIKYNSSLINTLYYSNINIKNNGNIIIDKRDIAPKNPLRFTTNGLFVTDDLINSELQEKYTDNNIKIDFNQDESCICHNAIVSFDFIERNQSITFSLAHTGDIHFNGRIMGGKLKESFKNNKKEFNIKRILLYCIITSIMVLIVSTISSLINTEIAQRRTDKLIENIQNLDESFFDEIIDSRKSQNTILYYYLKSLLYEEYLQKQRMENSSN